MRSKRTPVGALVSSALARRGSTGVDLRWYNCNEFKQLTQEQKDELVMWRASEAGKAIIKANKNQLKADRLAKKKNLKEGEEILINSVAVVTTTKLIKLREQECRRNFKRLLQRRRKN